MIAAHNAVIKAGTSMAAIIISQNRMAAHATRQLPPVTMNANAPVQAAQPVMNNGSIHTQAGI